MKIGQKFTAEVIVDKTNVASAVMSGNVDVFSTPMMVALMECASAKCIEPDLAEGMTSVGGYIATSHISASPIGSKVTATAEITDFTEKKVEFKVVAQDEDGVVGEGTHTRFIVNFEKFYARIQNKMK